MKNDRSSQERQDHSKSNVWLGARLNRWLKLAILVGWASGPLLAQTIYQWDGSSSTAWGTAANWTSPVVPNNNTAIAAFSSTWTTTTRSPTIANTAYTIGGILVQSTVPNTNINLTGGNRVLTINAGAIGGTAGAGGIGIDNQSIYAETISARMAITNSQTWQASNATSGSLTFSNTTAAIALAANALTLSAVNATNSITVSGPIAGTGGSLIVDGAGTVTLSGTNTFTGGTTLNAGTLSLGNVAALGAVGSALTINGGTLDLNTNTTVRAYNTTIGGDAIILSDRSTAGAGITHTLGTLSIGSNQLSVDAGTTVTANSAYGLTFGATTLTGNATFNVANHGTGTGTLTLGALGDGAVARTITFSGAGATTLGTAATSLVTGTTVNVAAGTLNSNNATALGTLADVTLSAGATVNVGAAQTFGGLSGAGGTVALGANTLTVGNATNNLSGAYSGTITGTGKLTKASSGTLTLASANTYSGGTTLSTGTLAIGNNASLGTGALTVNGGSLDASAGSLTASNAVIFGSGASLGFTGTNSLTLSGGVTLSGSNTVSVAANNLTLSGVIGGGASNLTKNGPGTLTLANAGNTYTGTTTISAGTLSTGNVVVSGGASGLGNATSAVVLGDTSNTGTLSYTGTTATYTRGFTVNAGGGAIETTTAGQTLTIATGNIASSGLLTVGGAGNTTVSSTISGTGALNKTGTGTLTLNSGTTNTLANITLTLGNISVTGTNTLVQAGLLSSSNASNVLTIDSSNTVQANYGSGTTTFTGLMAGAGTFQKDGAGTLLFNASFDAQSAGLSLVFNGGTVALAAGVQVKVGTIFITGDTTLDFGGATGTMLQSTNLIINPGIAVTVTNWASKTDFWYATSQFYQGTTNLNAARNVENTAPANQITFQGWDAANTTWIAAPYNGWSNNEIRPVPEPATYGAMFLSACLALCGWYRHLRRLSVSKG